MRLSVMKNTEWGENVVKNPHFNPQMLIRCLNSGGRGRGFDLRCNHLKLPLSPRIRLLWTSGWRTSKYLTSEICNFPWKTVTSRRLRCMLEGYCLRSCTLKRINELGSGEWGKVYEIYTATFDDHISMTYFYVT